MTNIIEQFEKWADVTTFSPIETAKDMCRKAYQTAHEAQQKRIDELELQVAKYQFSGVVIGGWQLNYAGKNWVSKTVYDNQQERVDKLEMEVAKLEMAVSEQLLVIKGFTLECKEMGTTDIITALARKDTKIAELTGKLHQAICLGIQAGRNECSDEMLGNANINYADADAMFDKLLLEVE